MDYVKSVFSLSPFIFHTAPVKSSKSSKISLSSNEPAVRLIVNDSWLFREEITERGTTGNRIATNYSRSLACNDLRLQLPPVRQHVRSSRVKNGSSDRDRGKRNKLYALCLSLSFPWGTFLQISNERIPPQDEGGDRSKMAIPYWTRVERFLHAAGDKNENWRMRGGWNIGRNLSLFPCRLYWSLILKLSLKSRGWNRNIIYMKVVESKSNFILIITIVMMNSSDYYSDS